MEVSGRRQAESDDVSTGILCDPCNGENDEENAVYYCPVCNEFLCNACAKAHKRLTISKHHQLLDRDSMPKQKPTSSGESTCMCTKHNGKLIEYFCKSHDDCCCSVCVTIAHARCKVENIDDIAIEYETSKEFTCLMSAIANLNQLLHNTKIIASKKRDDVGHIHMTFVSEVKKLRSEINQILDSLEQRTLIEAQTVRDKDAESTQSVSTTCSTMIASLNEMSSNIEKQQKCKQQRQLVISAKRAHTQMKPLKGLTTELDNKCTIRDYRFRPNETIIQSIKAVNSLGSLENTMEKEGKTKVEMMKTYAPIEPVLRYVAEINIQHSTDTAQYGDCLITGGVMLNNNMLALADYSNFSVKIVDVNGNKNISCIKLPLKPFGIMLVEQEQIVVTCDNTLVFIKVGKTMSVMKALDIGGKSRGIVYRNNTFICTFRCPGCVKIINLCGKILKTITTDIGMQTLVKSPYSIALNRDQNTLYVSDFVKKSVTSMDLDGNVKGVYKHEKLVRPYGVAVDRDNNIYIAGWESDSIHIISPQCKPIRVVQDGTQGMKHPYAVIYSERDNILYISHLFGNTVSKYQIE